MKNLNCSTLENMPDNAETVVGLIYDAWKPAIDLLFERQEAFDVIRHLMKKKQSELAGKNISVFYEGDDVVGIVVALDVSALKEAFQVNLFHFMHMAKDRELFLQKFGAYKAYAAPIANKGTYLSKFAVAPAYRGQGYGEKLMECFIDAERKKRTPAICLVVHRQNSAALSLYKKFSFIEAQAGGIAGDYMVMVKKLDY